MLEAPVNVVPIKNGINFRDLGGIKTQEGRKIRSGRLFRAGAFSDITAQEQHFLADDMQIKFILDYRDQAEITSRPDNVWNNSVYIHAPANPLRTEVTAALANNENDIQQELNQLLKKDSPQVFMNKLYTLLPFNNLGYKKLVDLLLNTNGESIVQHCAIGKDRTGIGVALTLFALGVDEEIILEDYLLTDKLLATYRDGLLQSYASVLDEEQLARRREVFVAKEEYFQAAMNAIKSKYQTIDNWLMHEYQLDSKNKAIIRDFYLK